MRFVPYHRIGGEPNVIVDGSATAGTVLTLSHWPGTETPEVFWADLSAEMAFRYVDRPELGVDAEIVSNNHFDQDGLVGVFALADPAAATARRELLIDVASAGDFGTYRDRHAARVAMAIASLADDELTPLGPLSVDYPTRCSELYERSLPMLAELCDHPERFESLWAEEDAALSASEALIATGEVGIEEVPAVDLAVVTMSPDTATGRDLIASDHDVVGPGAGYPAGLHPMAVFGATAMLGICTIRGSAFRFEYRYESWVQYRSRPVRPRVDLDPLAVGWNQREESGGSWTFDGPGALTPALTLDGAEASSIDPDLLRGELVEFLASAPPAWDPYV